MTTNQTIDGVPRELVEWMANSGELLELLGLCSGELRALLDAPVKKRPAWMDEPFAVAARGEERGSSHGFEQSPNTCRHDERSGVWWREGSITRTGRECCACGSVEEDPVKPASQPQGEPVAFQSRVHPWMLECFGEAIAADRQERNHRFLEEALELVQANQCTASEAHQLVDYVYGRPVGEPSQEVGGVMVTLAALCLATGIDMHAAGETELARIWTKVDQIRAKQAAKPAMSPLPGVYPDREQAAPVAVVLPELDESAIDDLAGSSCQEALAFGVHQDVFGRLARTVHKRTLDEVTRLNTK